MSDDVAVLLIAFNRPQLTAQVLQAIRCARPSRLYIAVDGSRGKADDAPCAMVRRMAKANWKCQVYTLFHDLNLGCRQGPIAAIDWFFEHEDCGIILEDDCVASATFFPYCAELLERYRDDERIMCISGDTFQPPRETSNSYYFSRYSHTWGWATWRRAWAKYDDSMREYPDFRSKLEKLSGVPGFAKFWIFELNRAHERKIDSWDHAWLFACWFHGGLTCTPRVNLVTNIGFGGDATHTHSRSSPWSNMPRFDIEIPLRHPRVMTCDTVADDYVTRTVFKAHLYDNRLRGDDRKGPG